MRKVRLKPGAGKHRNADRKLYKPGQEFEVTEGAFQAFRDKFDIVLSADELKAIAEVKAEEELEQKKQQALAKAKAAEEAALAAKAAGDKAGKTGTAGKG